MDTGKLQVLIVDDEPLARRRIRALLKGEKDVEIVGECGDGRQAIAAIQKQRPDLVFLDVQMPEVDGFGVVESVGAADMPAVVFVTAYDRYALNAFEVHALDYLLKPFDEERFQGALARARSEIRRERTDDVHQRLLALLEHLQPPGKHLDRLLVKSAGRIFFLKVEEIDWIEAAGNYVRLHVGKESHLVRETMTDLESRLDPGRFLRIHRSTLVNIDRIKELHPWFSGDYAVVLHDGTQLRLSRGHRERLSERLGNPV